MKKLLIPLILILFIRVGATNNRFVTGTIIDQHGNPLAAVNISEVGTNNATVSDNHGFYYLKIEGDKPRLLFEKPGYKNVEKVVGKNRTIDIQMHTQKPEFETEVFSEDVQEEAIMQAPATNGISKLKRSRSGLGVGYNESKPTFVHNTEGYSPVEEVGFKKVVDQPLSTFSIDVDAASYSNVRRFLNHGQLPPQDAVRIEEMINYFDYDYANPQGDNPLLIESELASSPWNENHLLLKVALQGKRIATKDLPSSNLVFLIDVSGSMQQANKLPLLKSAFKMLVNELRPQDRVSIVVYAGAAGLVLPSTTGNQKAQIFEALDKLSAGGSTAGGAGIKLAYKIAHDNYVKGGNNRVILATDGDFNVGPSSNGDMLRLIEQKRQEGVFLTTLGFGMGNYKDDKMELLADKGNGNYAYIDNIMEARKVLVSEFGGTLFTIAKDVKFQLEFNPAKVTAYRLIGYENRTLAAEDFNDDQKDAGELGSGHTVTALYEIIPAGITSVHLPSVDTLKYQSHVPTDKLSKEWLTMKLRYKAPLGNTSELIQKVVKGSPSKKMSSNMEWASSVAGFGMLLRDSEFKGNLTYESVLKMAKSSLGADSNGYRKEFIKLVSAARDLSPSPTEAGE